MKKKFLEILLVAIAVISISFLFDEGKCSFAETNGYMQKDALNYAISLVGEKWDVDNGSFDCVDIVKMYFKEIGGQEYMAQGNAGSYAKTAVIPDGWKRMYMKDGYKPQPGDVAVWDFNAKMWDYVCRVGHVGIVVGISGDTVTLVDQDSDTQRAANYSDYRASDVTCYIHPDFPVVPVSAEFVPIDGFQIEGYIGQKEFYCTSDLFGIGNKIIVWYSDGSSRSFFCKNDDFDGYYASEEDNDLVIVDRPLKLRAGLQKGENTITYKLHLYHEKEDVEYDPVNLRINCVANKYDAHVVYRNYTYTGKKIIIKPVVQNSVGKTLHKSAYTYSYTKHKKMGYYEVRVCFRNKELYPDYIIGEYSIGPKNPSIKNITAGVKCATITLNKLSEKQLRNIGRYEMIITSDKEWIESDDFEYDDLIYVKKNKTKIIAKHLIKGKTYYVKVRAYKSGVYSDWSKIRKVKIK